VKALAEASKNGYLYILDRETGTPVHPIKETPVPTETARAGEQPWPTQPIPYTAAGPADEPVSPVFPIDVPTERLVISKPVPQFTPPDRINLLAWHRGGAITVRCPTARAPGCSTSTPSTARSAPGVPREGISRRSIRAPASCVATDVRRLGPGGVGGHRRRLVFVGTGSNSAGFLFA